MKRGTSFLKKNRSSVGQRLNEKILKNLLGIWNFVREQTYARIQKTSISTHIILDGSFKLLEQENLPGEEGPD